MYLIAYLISVRSSSIDNTTYLFIGYQYFILQLQRNKKGWMHEAISPSFRAFHFPVFWKVYPISLTRLRIVFHLFQHSLFPVLHSFLMPRASFSSVPFTCLIVMKPVSHHDETSVSSRWNLCLITMKLTLSACVNDAQHVRKKWGTGDK